MHTQGPWHANTPRDEKYADGSNIREPINGDIVATVSRPRVGEVIANARLIAAAPELLSALEALTEWGRTFTSPLDSNFPHGLLVAACEAINKAKGGA